jgi:hypothetical protein
MIICSIRVRVSALNLNNVVEENERFCKCMLGMSNLSGFITNEQYLMDNICMKIDDVNCSQHVHKLSSSIP